MSDRECRRAAAGPAVSAEPRGGYIFLGRDALILGGTVERGIDDATPDEGACMRILERKRRLFEEAVVV